MAFSYWESKEWLEGLDLCIVGGGIVGISAAIFAKERHPGWRIVVLESTPFGGGGSSKNAGFACFGSASELRQDRMELGDEEALQLVKMRLEGLQLLRKTLGDEAIGFRACGSIEFFVPGGLKPMSADALVELNHWVSGATAVPNTFEICTASKFSEYASRLEELAIFSRLEGVIDTGQLNRAMRKRAEDMGIDLIYGLKVKRLDQIENGWSVQMEQGKDSGEFLSPRVVIATNAFARELLPEVDVVPAMNRVLVTEPIPAWNFHHAVHLEAGYVYARSIGNRMLIGGGRHWNLPPEETEKKLQDWLHSLWPRTQQAGIAYRWVGFLGIGSTRQPVVRKIAPGAVAAVRMGGMGVAIGMQIGKHAAELLSSD